MKRPARKKRAPKRERIVVGYRLLKYVGPESWVRRSITHPNRCVQGYIEVGPEQEIAEVYRCIGEDVYDSAFPERRDNS